MCSHTVTTLLQTPGRSDIALTDNRYVVVLLKGAVMDLWTADSSSTAWHHRLVVALLHTTDNSSTSSTDMDSNT